MFYRSDPPTHSDQMSCSLLPWSLLPPSSCSQLHCHQEQGLATALLLPRTQHVCLEHILDQDTKNHSQIPQFRYTLLLCFILASSLFFPHLSNFSLYCLHSKKENLLPADEQLIHSSTQYENKPTHHVPAEGIRNI